jgi:hypothetical protein
MKRNTSYKQPTTFQTKPFILAIVLSLFLQFMATGFSVLTNDKNNPAEIRVN